MLNQTFFRPPKWRQEIMYRHRRTLGRCRLTTFLESSASGWNRAPFRIKKAVKPRKALSPRAPDFIRRPRGSVRGVCLGCLASNVRLGAGSHLIANFLSQKVAAPCKPREESPSRELGLEQDALCLEPGARSRSSITPSLSITADTSA